MQTTHRFRPGDGVVDRVDRYPHWTVVCPSGEIEGACRTPQGRGRRIPSGSRNWQVAGGRLRGLGKHPRGGIPVSPGEPGGRAGIGHNRIEHNKKVASRGGNNGRDEGMVERHFPPAAGNGRIGAHGARGRWTVREVYISEAVAELDQFSDDWDHRVLLVDMGNPVCSHFEEADEGMVGEESDVASRR